MKRAIIAALVLVGGTNAALGNEEYSSRDIVSAAKLTGACGVYIQVQNFQLTTQLAGGDVFVERFMATEAARLGWTVDQLTENCMLAVKNFIKFNKLLSELDSQSK